jgi:DNA-binding CsgD family transcriptional regulator
MVNKHKMDISIEDFFRPIHLDTIPSSYDYGIVKYYTRVAEALSQLAYHSIYLIDYYKRAFLYVSENPLFLCGKSAHQVMQAGYSFYLKNVPFDDLKLLLEINEAGFYFYNKIPLDERTDYSIAYDFRLKQPNGHLMLINHKLAPLVLEPSGNIWIALCLVSLSSNNKPGNIVIKNTKEQKIFEYDLALKKWNEQKIVKLNNQEKEILMLACQGQTVQRIAKELYLSVDTIKFHKKNLFKKLKADSISEAILAAINIGII